MVASNWPCTPKLHCEQEKISAFKFLRLSNPALNEECLSRSLGFMSLFSRAPIFAYGVIAATPVQKIGTSTQDLQSVLEVQAGGIGPFLLLMP